MEKKIREKLLKMSKFGGCICVPIMRVYGGRRSFCSGCFLEKICKGNKKGELFTTIARNKIRELL